MTLLVEVSLLVAIPLSPYGRTGLQTVYIVAEVLPGLPSWPLGWMLASTAREERINIAGADGSSLPLHIYRPRASGQHPTLILALGATADYRQPALLRLASSLAKTGRVAVIPESPPLAEGFFDKSEVENLIATFLFLQSQPYVAPEQIGFSGFSVGASLALLAAADARISSSVAFVNFFGGYHDLSDYAAEVMSSSFRDGNKATVWDRSPTTVRVLRMNLARHVQDPEQRKTLENALNGSLTDLSELGLEAAAIYNYLTSSSFEDAKRFETQLAEAQRQRFEELSPEGVTLASGVSVYIMVDRSDRMVPYVHSKRMAEELGEGLSRYTAVSGFAHVRPSNVLSFIRSPIDFWRLVRHINMVLAKVGSK